MSDRLGDRIDDEINQESAIDQWWASHGKSIKETFERYKVWASTELRRTQIQLARVTEERDVLLKRLLETNRRLDRIKETLHD